MSIDERDRRAGAGGRDGAGRAPRSGGRTTEQRETTDTIRRTPRAATPERGAAERGTAVRGAAARGFAVRGTADRRGSTGGARGARSHETRGTAALKVDPADSIRVTAAEPSPRLRVAPPAPIRTPRAPFIAVVVAIVLAGVLGILWINTKTMENAFQIDRLQKQQSALDNQQQQLERQLASYENTGNLDAAARMLGLVKSDLLVYITLPNGDMLGVPKPNTSQPALSARNADTAEKPDADAAKDAGAAQDGAAQDGAAQDGAAQDGAAQDAGR